MTPDSILHNPAKKNVRVQRVSIFLKLLTFKNLCVKLNYESLEYAVVVHLPIYIHTF